MDYISILDASTVSGKSIQTIRRMIKAKKIRVTKQKTPQGFVYLIDRTSLEEFLAAGRLPLSIHAGINDELPVNHKTISQTPRSIHADSQPAQQETLGALSNQWQQEVEKFNSTIQKMIEQNERDKENFFGLIKNFQDRVFVLENQIKLLEAPKKSWWRLW